MAVLLPEIGRFLQLMVLGAVVYVAYGYRAGHDVELLTVAIFFAGCLAIVLLTRRFAEDFAEED